jgi:hypothetical protein
MVSDDQTMSESFLALSIGSALTPNRYFTAENAEAERRTAHLSSSSISLSSPLSSA